MSPLRVGLFLGAFLSLTAAPCAAGEPAKPSGPALDRHGDPLPPGARLRLGTTRFRAAAHVLFVAYSPDGKVLASADGSGAVIVWEAATGKALHRFFPGFVSTSCPFAFTPDGKLLAVLAVRDQDRVVQFWDLASGKEVRTITAAKNGSAAFAFAPGGKTVAVVGSDLNVRLVDTADGKDVGLVRCQGLDPGDGVPSFQPAALAFSADGKTLAVGGHNGKVSVVRVWDIAAGKDLMHVSDLPTGLIALRFSPDGKLLAVRDSTRPQTTSLLDATTGQPVRQLTGRSPYQADAFSPDGKLLASAGADSVSLEDPAAGKEVRRLTGFFTNVTALAFSPDGKTVATGGLDGTIRPWDVATGKEALPQDGHHGQIHLLAYSPDGKLLATAGVDRTVRLWDAATGKEVRRLPRPKQAEGGPDLAWPAQMAFSRDGKTLAAAWQAGCVCRWDVATGKVISQLEDFATPALALAFSPDGKWLAWAGNDGVVRLREVATGKEVRRIPGADAPPASNNGTPNQISALAFSPDGKTLLAGYNVNFALGHDLNLRGFLPRDRWPMPAPVPTHVPVRLWEVSTGKERLQFALPLPAGQAQPLLLGSGQDQITYFLNGGAITGARFAPDGRSVALCTGNTFFVWDFLKGKLVRQLDNQVWVYAFAFSPDGRYLATTAADGTVALHEVGTGRELGPLTGHQSPPAFLIFSPDGKSLATAGSDSTVLVWDLAAVRETVRRPRQLSAERLESLWTELAGGDANKAYQAVRTLATTPDAAVAHLQTRLKPVPAADAQRIARLIADLDSDNFEERKQATEELEKLGELAETALERVLAGQPSLEVRQRAEALLDRLRQAVASPEALRQGRALEVLELSGTAEARRLLEELAKGAPEARLTRDAQEALERLARRAK